MSREGGGHRRDTWWYQEAEETQIRLTLEKKFGKLGGGNRVRGTQSWVRRERGREDERGVGGAGMETGNAQVGG